MPLQLRLLEETSWRGSVSNLCDAAHLFWRNYSTPHPTLSSAWSAILAVRLTRLCLIGIHGSYRYFAMQRVYR